MGFGVPWPGRSPYRRMLSQTHRFLLGWTVPWLLWIRLDHFMASLDPRLVPVPGMHTSWRQPETDEGTQKAEGCHHVRQKWSPATVCDSPGA